MYLCAGIKWKQQKVCDGCWLGELNLCDLSYNVLVIIRPLTSDNKGRQEMLSYLVILY